VISCGLAGRARGAPATVAADSRRAPAFLIATTAWRHRPAPAWFALAASPIALGFAAFLGMVNGMGRDRGAALILEQGRAASTATDATRTR